MVDLPGSDHQPRVQLRLRTPPPPAKATAIHTHCIQQGISTMEDRFNTIAGWVLGAGIVALGGALLSGELFKHHPVEKGGYTVAEAEMGGGGAATAKPIDWSTADAAAGADVFKQCASCHTIEQGGANGTGPNLWGTMGKAHGIHAGYSYSDGFKAVKGTWTFEDMDKWLLNPKKYAPGTKMGYGGLPDPVKRGNVIAYLNSSCRCTARRWCCGTSCCRSS
jgi:cytochrome c